MSQQTYFDTHSINHILYPKMFNVRVLPNTHADIKSIALEKKKIVLKYIFVVQGMKIKVSIEIDMLKFEFPKCIKDYSCNLYDINVSKFCNKPVRL